MPPHLCSKDGDIISFIFYWHTTHVGGNVSAADEAAPYRFGDSGYAVVNFEFRKDVLEMALDAVASDAELISDFVIGKPLRQEFQDVDFAPGHVAHRLAATEEVHDYGREESLPLGDCSDGRQHIVRIAILEKIAPCPCRDGAAGRTRSLDSR